MKVLKTANIYTGNEQNPWAEVLAIDEKRILFVGSEAEWEQKISKKRDEVSNFAETQEIYDLQGKMILPGFIDSHVHPGMCSKSVWHVRLPWTYDVKELLAFIQDYAENHPKEEAPFLYFEYYPTAMFDEHGPTKELLDEAVSDRPCLCQDFGEHLCWVNSKMLQLLKVNKETPDPNALEVFVRDEKGEPTGWIKEMAWVHFAENLFHAIKWQPPEELTREQLRPFFNFMKESGITAIFDGFIESDMQIQSIYEMDRAGELDLYYDGSVRFWNYEDLPEKIKKLREYQKAYTTQHIKINTMKMFLDGTNESGNSASLHPHINEPDNYGEMMMEKEELVKCFLLCNEEGLDVHIHMVGDRAFRTGCDAVEEAQYRVKTAGDNWVCQPIFAHCEVVDPTDMHRPAQLGITVNWSCHWSGGYFGEEAMNYFTEEKWRRMYQFNQMIDSGALIAFSSDVVTNYELHRADPLFGMQVAATRIDPEFPLDPDRYPDSIRPEKAARIPLDILVRGYTQGGARQLRWEENMGTLETGKLANLVVLNQDIFKVPIETLKNTEVETVFFDGKVVKGIL